jgi:hypothetical protein
MWNQLRREFLYAAEKLEAEGLSRPRAHMLWRAFWASHQRFFRHMCMAAKVSPLKPQCAPRLLCLKNHGCTR